MNQWNEEFKKHGRIFLQPQEDINWVAKVLKKNNVRKVLDLGCGSGRHTVYLAEHGFKVFGLDIAEEGVRLAKLWLKRKKLQAHFQVGSIYRRLPYPDNFFEAVVSTDTIHHERIGHIRKLIKEIERIVKPRGFIFITVRKRKFRKNWPKNTIINKRGHQKVGYQVLGSRTYAPFEGAEKGLPHYLFNQKLIAREFRRFHPNIWVDSTRKHYCLLGQLKTEKRPDTKRSR